MLRIAERKDRDEPDFNDIFKLLGNPAAHPPWEVNQ